MHKLVKNPGTNGKIVGAKKGSNPDTNAPMMIPQSAILVFMCLLK